MKTKLLVIEDNLDHQKILEKLLEQDFAIEFVSSTSAGLERQARAHFDLILVDFNLGDMTGIDFVRLARESRNLNPIVLMSSKMSLQMRIEARKAGATFCLEKEQVFAGRDQLIHLLQGLIEESRRKNGREKLLGIYSEVLENDFHALLLLDSSGKILLANRKFRKMLGVSSEELISNKFPRFVDKSFRPELFRFLKNMLVGKETIPFAVKLKNSRNHLVEVSLSGRPILGETETPWILLEVQAKLEEGLLPKQNSWKDFFTWLRDLQTGLVVVDSREQIIFWNNEASLEFKLPHFRGQTLPLDHLLEMDSIRQFRRAIFRDGGNHPVGKRFKFTGQNTDGQTLYLRCHFVGGAYEQFLIVRAAPPGNPIIQKAFQEKELLNI